ncbi:MAG TPA: SRPBCC family protein [Nitrolancea sp.]|nr:SRPBCC family protein [Nitrolancea sp.]
MTDGTIEEHDGIYTFRYEREFPQPIERVWRAITDPAEIEAWTGSRPEIDLRPGGRYVTHHGNGMTVVDRVERVEPPHLLQHTFWLDVNPSALVTWELSPTEHGCRLTLTHKLSRADVEAAANSVAQGDSVTLILSRNAAGWHQLLNKLAARLAGRDGTCSDEGHQALLARYAKLVG